MIFRILILLAELKGGCLHGVRYRKNDDCTETIAAVNPIMKRFLEGPVTDDIGKMAKIQLFYVGFG